MTGVSRMRKFAVGLFMTTGLVGLIGSQGMAATPPNFTPPDNLVASVNGNVVTLTWEIPAGISDVAMWDVGWYDMETGARTGGWGIWVPGTETTATVTIADDTSGDGPSQIVVRAGNGPCIGEGTGNCVYGPEATVDVSIDASAYVPETTVATEAPVVMSATGSTEAPSATISTESNDEDGDEGGSNTGLTIAIAALAVVILVGVVLQAKRGRKTS